ncbi:unnamed protein product [Closterium sp. Naga37s-1]|nr:unnamed protein product [Closterium sp. Naga37s-1]
MAAIHPFIEQLNAAMYAEDRNIVLLLDNASSHVVKSEGATLEDLFGFYTLLLSNIRLVYLPPNTTCFTHPLDQGFMATAKARYLARWLRGNGAANIELEEVVGDVGILIDRLGLGSGAKPAAEFVCIDDNQPTCAEPGEDPLATEPPAAPATDMWEALTSMQDVYHDSNPESREARRYARAACKMLIGYAKVTDITKRDLCVLFDIRNPIIRARMERASPPLNLNMTPPPAMPLAATPPAETPRRRGCVLPPWTTEPTPLWVALAQQAARRQELIDTGAPTVTQGYLDAAE